MKRTLFAATAIAAFPMVASAASIISDGNVKLGVDDFGQLNIEGRVDDVSGEDFVGVRWLNEGLEYESTSHGCLCEGWGISVNGSIDGGANNDDAGGLDITGVSFESTATTAKSVVQLDGTEVFVTHDFALSASDDLYEVKVKIENRSGEEVTDVTYRRAMDWDTSPTPFDEFVTIGGTATTTLLKNSSDDGFLDTESILSNPIAGSDRAGCGEGVDFVGGVDCDYADHGAVFDFDFGDLAAGEEYDFSIFYGGAANKDAADAALGLVGAELFSYGWSCADPDQNGLAPSTSCVDEVSFLRAVGLDSVITPTYIFAFKGVGGEIIIPPPDTTAPVPLPAGAWLMLGGMGAFAAMRRRKKKMS